MAVWYVDDAATDNTGDGQSSSTPKKWLWLDIGTNDALFNIATPPAAGDTVYVKTGHNEAHTVGLTLSNNGTVVDPIRIFPVSDLSSPSLDTVTANGDKGALAITGALTLLYGLHIYGFLLQASNYINISTQMIRLASCKLDLNTTASYKLRLANAHHTYTKLEDCDIEFGGSTQGINISSAGVLIEMDGGAVSGTDVNVLLGSTTYAGDIVFRNYDLSNLTNSLVTSGVRGLVRFERCQLGSGVALVSGTLTSHNARVEAYGCTQVVGTRTGGEHVELIAIWIEDYFGTVRDETTIYRDGGATHDGTNEYCVKLTSNANVSEWTQPLYFDLPALWAEADATFTVHLAQADGASNLQDDELWIEVIGPDADTPQGIRGSSKAADPIAPSDLASSSETWTGLTGEVTQKAAVTLSGTRAGYHTIRVHLAKPSTGPVYVCPQVEVE